MNLSLRDYTDNFPFPQTIRPRQIEILEKICDGFNEDYRFIILEAPTGFGKSPVGMTVARTLGSSYVCSGTTDLQTQYNRDFSFLKPIMGMGNFSCIAKEDMIANDTFECGTCGPDYEECKHKSVNHGYCRDNNAYTHDPKDCRCKTRAISGEFHLGCRYRTFPEDYEIADSGTGIEDVFITPERFTERIKFSTQVRSKQTKWMHLSNLKPKTREIIKRYYTPCPYYDQLNKGILATHSILNYANFLVFLHIERMLKFTNPNARNILPDRDLLILDEGHEIENQVINQISLTLSRHQLEKYISTRDLFESRNHPLESDSIINEWIPFIHNVGVRLHSAIDDIKDAEIRIDARQYLEKLGFLLDALNNPRDDWIISGYETDHRGLKKVQFKPLNAAYYCQPLLEKCSRTIIMSATILDVDTFCRNIGLDRDHVLFIETGSEFPVESRLVHVRNTAYLNHKSLQQDHIRQQITDEIDRIMNIHSDEKGIIHTTSYEQVNFIERLLSDHNRKRLIKTGNGISRSDIVAEHRRSNDSKVLISPSLHTGLDLKDELSRFQILVKVPWPDRSDRWIAKKLLRDPDWYNWQTSLRLVQACGRSVRSKDDYAKTYVLDSLFGSFMNRNRLPYWFRESVRYN